MGRRAAAVSHGAVTVINAIASGIGSAIGIDLWTRAEVEILPEKKILASIPGHETADTTLIKNCVRKVFEKHKITDLGAKVTTQSNIPICKGLKSSSAAANAVTLATIKALDLKASDIEIVKIGVEAALDSKVTITGAFDDASASYFGGLVLTDNVNRRLLLRRHFDEKMKAVILIPRMRRPTRTTETLTRTRLLNKLITPLTELVKSGSPELAMSLNGFLYGACYNSPIKLIFKALEAGAAGASVSGTGPAIAALIDEGKVDELRKSWSGVEGEIRVADINNRKASVV